MSDINKALELIEPKGGNDVPHDDAVEAAALLKKSIDRLTGALKHALAWCKVDRDNEDGYPTQEMFENRVDLLDEVLKEVMP